MAANNGCIGIKADGIVCGKRCRDNNTRCSTHLTVLENNGPHTLAQKELGYVHKKHVKDIENRYDELVANMVNPNMVQRRRMQQDMWHEIQQLRARQAQEMTLLVRQQEDEVRRTGVDPDAAARARAAERDRIRDEQWRLQRENRMAWNRERDRENAAVVLAHAHQLLNQGGNNAVQQRADPRVGELERFARDNQNVHTTVAVEQTKDMIERILKIAIPNEYKWNMRTCSKTPGDISLHCNLTPKGAWQMFAKYCQDEDVYELGKGIYGKVLDGVWQFILNSPDKSDLCKILRQEMEDNIGMCAQGNLTRLCNILAGYMEGIGVQESPAEILGRKLPMLMQIEDQATRLKEAFNLLTETGIPTDQWVSWIEPLVEEGTVRITLSPQGQVIGVYVS